MGSTGWAAALMAVLAVVIALSFITLWVRDKNRADEVADDPERTDDSTAAPQHGTRPGADGLG
jgi:hypothetical protein